MWKIKRTLRTFQELTIRGRESDLCNFFEALTIELEQTEGWERNTDREEQYRGDNTTEADIVYIKTSLIYGKEGLADNIPVLSEEKTYTFEYQDLNNNGQWDPGEPWRISGLPSNLDGEDKLQADIILTSRKPHNEYRVTNIIPLSKPSLDYDEYNMVLNIFYDLFIKDKYKKYKLDVDLSKPEVSLDKYLSEESLKFLGDFSVFADKSTGLTHPSSRGRWNKFIISVCKGDEERAIGIADMVRRWLVEVGGWSESVAGELVVEFEFGLALLKQYNEEVARELVNVK